MSDEVARIPGRRLCRNLRRGAFGVPAFVLTHGWRNRYVARSGAEVDEPGEPEPLPTPGDDIKHLVDGVGPLLQRTYAVEVDGATRTAAELQALLTADPNRFNDERSASFRSGDELACDLTVGQDLVVEIPGPWNGPVRIVRTAPDLLLATRSGHLEAGHIRFRFAEGDEPGRVRFEIRSWSRAGDPAFAVLHLVIPVGREFQTAQWVAMCDHAVAVSGGRRHGPIRVETLEVRREPRPAAVGDAPRSS